MLVLSETLLREVHNALAASLMIISLSLSVFLVTNLATAPLRFLELPISSPLALRIKRDAHLVQASLVLTSNERELEMTGKHIARRVARYRRKRVIFCSPGLRHPEDNVLSSGIRWADEAAGYGASRR